MSTMIEGEMRDLRVGNRQLVTALIASVLGWSLDLFDLFVLFCSNPMSQPGGLPTRSQSGDVVGREQFLEPCQK